MRIKSTVWHVMAGGSFCVGLLYALGIEGGAQVGGTISDGQFVTAMGLILLAVLCMQLGFRAQEREERNKKRKKTPQPPVGGSTPPFVADAPSSPGAGEACPFRGARKAG